MILLVPPDAGDKEASSMIDRRYQAHPDPDREYVLTQQREAQAITAALQDSIRVAVSAVLRPIVRAIADEGADPEVRLRRIRQALGEWSEG